MSYLPANVEFNLIVPSVHAATHRNAMKHVSRLIAPYIGVGERVLFTRLMDQETQKAASTAHGSSIMHLPISGLSNPFLSLIQLQSPIDFKAHDNIPVDLLCLLLTPSKKGIGYLQTLARLSRLLRDAQICHMLRSSSSEQDLRLILNGSAVRTAAA
jgi:nitrogen PTS system EIIA component